jgi:hypothetical protein
MRTAITPKRILTLTLNPASVAANVSANQSFTVNEGLTTEDFVMLRMPSLVADLAFCNEHISANGTLTVRFTNTTGSAIDDASQTAYLLVF